MNLPRIVCPNSKNLLRSLTGHTVAVRVKNPRHAAEAAGRVWESRNSLFCVIIETDSPLDKIELPEGLKDIPLAVMAGSLGKFRNLARHLCGWRDFNLRVYLPCERPGNMTGLRVLSSVGIHGCAVFGNGKTDWEALTDLMTYAVLERTPHASIEPFAFIASNFDPFSYLEWSSLYFNDPRHFLHLDARGHVALSHGDLIKKRFIAQNIAEIASTDEFPSVRKRKEAWRKYFVDNHPCASCVGWKICMGKFSAYLNKNRGCSAFFQEMIEVARQHKSQSKQVEERQIWQP